MLTSDNNRFPNSSALFFFCKEILNINKTDSERITDQEVGALLEFDPADCTHWKHGRKNIKNIGYLNRLSKLLNVDANTINDIARGKKSYTDALTDYRIHNGTSCEAHQRQLILKEVEKIIVNANIQSLPVFLPELLTSLPYVHLSTREDNLSEGVLCDLTNGLYSISYPDEPMTATLRYLITREIAGAILAQSPLRAQLSSHQSQTHLGLCIMFLLMPQHLLQRAWVLCDPAEDQIERLASYFWVSRSLVNYRIKDFFSNI